MGRRVWRKSRSVWDMLHFRCLLAMYADKSNCQGYECGAPKRGKAGVTYLGLISFGVEHRDDVESHRTGLFQ